MCRETRMGVAAAQLALPTRACDRRRARSRPSGVVLGSDYMLTMPEDFSAGMKNCRTTPATSSSPLGQRRPPPDRPAVDAQVSAQHARQPHRHLQRPPRPEQLAHHARSRLEPGHRRSLPHHPPRRRRRDGRRRHRHPRPPSARCTSRMQEEMAAGTRLPPKPRARSIATAPAWSSAKAPGMIVEDSTTPPPAAQRSYGEIVGYGLELRHGHQRHGELRAGAPQRHRQRALQPPNSSPPTSATSMPTAWGRKPATSTKPAPSPNGLATRLRSRPSKATPATSAPAAASSN